MSRVAFILTLFVAALVVVNGYPVKGLVEPVLTIYLIIAGFLIIVYHRRSWEFIRPLLVVGLALLLLPPLFHELVRNLGVSLGFNFWFAWLWLPLLIVVAIGSGLLVGVSAGRRFPRRNRSPYPPPGAQPIRRPHRARRDDDD